MRFAAYKEVRGHIGAQKSKSEVISEEALDAYNGTKVRPESSQRAGQPIHKLTQISTFYQLENKHHKILS